MSQPARNRKMVLVDWPHILGTLGPFLRPPQSTQIKDRLDEFRAAAAGFDVHYVDRPEENLQGTVEDAEVIAALGLGPDAFAMARKLQWLHVLAAGVEFTLYPALIESPVVVTSSKGNAGVPMAEWAMMQIYMWTKQVMRYVAAQARREWDTGHHGELTGMTIGIIGLGNSGADLARKCNAAHMEVLGLRRSDAPCEFVDEMYTRDRLHEFLARSDFVCVTVPRTPETQGMLGEAEFRAMKSSAYFIVTSRGGIAQDQALLKALREGWIAGASLDAHTQEPLPADSPFWTAPNAFVTPHTAASGRLSSKRLTDMLLANVRRYARGEPLMQMVDKRAGY